MNPASLPWWGWLLYAAGAIVVGYGITLFTTDKEPRSELSIALPFIFGVAAIFCGIIGIILFVEWVWRYSA